MVVREFDLGNFLQKERLPETFRDTTRDYYQPFADALINLASQTSEPLFVGLVGCQGSGKSTLAKYLECYLNNAGKKALQLSLDDFYLSKASRQNLAASIHPLLETRGVPLTHDTDRIFEVLSAFREASGSVSLPLFSKALDDVDTVSEPRVINADVDVIIFEGWCWGARSVPENALTKPCNELERVEDADASWRVNVNSALKEDYEPLYAFFDLWCFLKAPSFECVYEWRLEQERKLIQQLEREAGESVLLRTYDEAGLRRFVLHYQRLTEQLLDSFADTADVVWELDRKRKVSSMRARGQLAKKGFELCLS